jgi:hypothetical protein
VAVLKELVQGVRPGAAVQRVAVARRLPVERPFTPLNERSFAFTHELSEDGLVDRVCSTSYVAALPDADRSLLVGQVRALVADVPHPLVLPYRTDVFCCRGT